MLAGIFFNAVFVFVPVEAAEFPCTAAAFTSTSSIVAVWEDWAQSKTGFEFAAIKKRMVKKIFFKMVLGKIFLCLGFPGLAFFAISEKPVVMENQIEFIFP